MDETKKTGLFCAVAAVVASLGIFVNWKSEIAEEGPGNLVDTELFKFEPQQAGSMKIVTFDDAQGQIANFEVRRAKDTGAWTIPSRDGYPADGVDQMEKAANALVGLKILDVPPSNAEDHPDYGVVEPKLEDLDIGDEGVGRLVTLKDDDQKTLASLIIGNPVKDQDGQVYVRKPGQDPVYVVKLDDSPITTDFQAWIEDDLLKLSSIEIDTMQVKDYSTSLAMGGQISLSRKFEADLKKDGTKWGLSELREFDPKNPRSAATKVDVKADEELNDSKMTNVQNALDELKIVDVVRKPDGMSANLRASEDFMSDQDAISSLAQRGFFPVGMAGGETEILSANGEMTVGLKDGVEYILRFGKIAGLAQEDDDAEKSDDDENDLATGVNRYMLVTTRLDESKIPVPELKEIPKTVAEMEEMDRAEEEKNALPTEIEPTTPEPPSEPTKENDAVTDDAGKTEEMKDKPAEDGDADKKSADDAKPDEKTEATSDQPGEDSTKADKEADATDDKAPVDEKPAEQKPESGEDKAEASDDAKSAEAGESEGESEGEGTGSGQGQEADDKDGDTKDDDDTKGDGDKDSAEETEPAEAKDSGDAADKKAPNANEGNAGERKADEGNADEGKSDASDDKADAAADDKKAEPEEEKEELTEEEKLERLDAVQDKIRIANQRKMDERKDKLEKAQEKVNELNARFADWYYVIPEETYVKLKIERDDLFKKAGEDAAGGPPQGFSPPGGIQLPNFGN